MFYLYLFHEKGDLYKDCLERVLASLKTGRVQFGGQKTNGSGFLRLSSLKYSQFDMKDPNGRTAWAEENRMDNASGKKGHISQYSEISNKLSAVEASGTAYVITLSGKTEGSLMVSGLAADGVGKEAPDAENMKNAAGQCYAKAHYLAAELEKAGLKRCFEADFFNEFVTECADPEGLLARLDEKGILGGLPVENGILWCATELNSKEEIDALVKEVSA